MCHALTSPDKAQGTKGQNALWWYDCYCECDLFASTIILIQFSRHTYTCCINETIIYLRKINNNIYICISQPISVHNIHVCAAAVTHISIPPRWAPTMISILQQERYDGRTCDTCDCIYKVHNRCWRQFIPRSTTSCHVPHYTCMLNTFAQVHVKWQITT